MPAEREPRPFYDPKTRTHYVGLPAVTFDQLYSFGMLDISLFADSIAHGEWVWLESDDGRESLHRVTGIAAVLMAAPEGEPDDA